MLQLLEHFDKGAASLALLVGVLFTLAQVTTRMRPGLTNSFCCL